MSTSGDKTSSTSTSGFPSSSQLRTSSDSPPRSVTPQSQRIYAEPATAYSFEASRATSPLPQSNNPYRESMSESNNQEASGSSSTKMAEERKRINFADNVSEMSVQVAGKNASTTSLTDSANGDSSKPRPKTTTFAITEKDIAEREVEVSRQDKRDMTVKFRIRVAKCFLRCLNFGCSLVVLSLISSAFSIFLATKNLATRNNLSPWSPLSTIWPAITTLCIAALSLSMACIVLYSYYRGGHRRAEKAAIWFTAASIGGFLVMIVLWGISAGIMTNARNNSKGSDLWAWSCKDNNRKELFQSDIDYDLVCRQMDWSFVCAFIDISIEMLSILLYAAAFWRFASKSKLRKSMDVRDQARKSVYLEKLKNGDMDAYRRAPDLEDGGDGYRKPEDEKSAMYSDGQYLPYGEAHAAPSYQYPPPPNSYHTTGALPIIDPNSGLSIDPVTGEATKPGTYQPPTSHAM